MLSVKINFTYESENKNSSEIVGEKMWINIILKKNNKYVTFTLL